MLNKTVLVKNDRHMVRCDTVFEEQIRAQAGIVPRDPRPKSSFREKRSFAAGGKQRFCEAPATHEEVSETQIEGQALIEEGRGNENGSLTSSSKPQILIKSYIYSGKSKGQ